MLIGLLYTLFVLLCFFIVFVILLQKSKGSLGLVGSFGSANVLFGGSGGQDIFQKITWTAVALFMGGSLVLSILKNRSVRKSRYLEEAVAASVLASSAISQPTAPVVMPDRSTQSTASDSSAREEQSTRKE
jgi:preprotein translocase subunit SecG